jgi:hypothetical protein
MAPRSLPSASRNADFGLAFWAARHHPVPHVRSAACELLASWAGVCAEAIHTPPSVELAFRESPLAPFVATAEDLADLSAMRVLACSDRVRASRLRVASADAVLGQFGLELYAGGRIDAVHGRLDRASRGAVNPQVYLWPASRPTAAEWHSVAEPIRATTCVTEAGLTWSISVPEDVRVSLMPAAIVGAALVRGPSGQERPLATLGATAAVTSDGVALTIRRPEAIIATTALCAQGGVLAIDLRGDAAWKVAIRLAPPGSTPLTLDVRSWRRFPRWDRWCHLLHRTELEGWQALRRELFGVLGISYVPVDTVDSLQALMAQLSRNTT